LQLTTNIEIVEPFPSGERERAETLRLVGLTVADEGPDLATTRVDDASVVQVAHEPRLVDRHQGAEPHRDGRELPELRHQPRMRVRGEAPGLHLLPEVVQLLLGEAPFEKGAGIDARRGMSLDVEQIPAMALARGVEEMVEADVVERRGGSEARDVTPERGILAIGLDHHRHRVPSHEGANPLLERRVPRRSLLQGLGDRVDVRRRRAVREMSALATSPANEATDEVVGSFDALPLEDRVEGLEPLARLLRIVIHGGRPPRAVCASVPALRGTNSSHVRRRDITIRRN
jgi:hypothetical protein